MTTALRADELDPDAVRRDVEEILGRPEFDYGPSWWERALEWLAERLDDLLGPLLPGGAAFGGGASSVVAWIVIVLAALLVAYLVFRVVRHRVRRRREDVTPFDVEVDPALPAAHWRDEAERFEADGAWREALRSRVRLMVRSLADRGVVADLAGRTTGELRTEIRGRAANVAGDSDVVFERFEAVWYGGDGHDAAQHAALVERVDAVLDAASTPVDRAGVR